MTELHVPALDSFWAPRPWITARGAVWAGVWGSGALFWLGLVLLVSFCWD